MSILLCPFNESLHLEQTIDSIMRVRDVYGVYPPKQDVGDDRQEFSDWLLEEEVLVRIVALEQQVTGHVSLTHAHPYLTKHLAGIGHELEGKGYVEVSKLFVDPLAHAKGTGALLLQAMIDHSRENDFQLALAVIETSTAAIELYQRLGLHAAGEFDGIHGRNLVFVD